MGFLANKYWPSIVLFSFLILFSSCLGNANYVTTNQKVTNTSKTILVFGDSTMDPGNNNVIKTLFKSDFPPYGVDLPDHQPTGRFCNGRLATDFIASYAGIKDYIPPYVGSTLTLDDLVTGVSFASAGSGYDSTTAAITNVITMSQQLKYFDEYKRTVESKIGKKKMKALLKHSVVIVSCGSNDIIYTYGVVQTPIDSYTVPFYLQYLLDQNKLFLQGLMDRGAETIAVVSMPPVGCVPAMITLHAVDKHRTCVESLSAMCRDFNQMLQNLLKTLQASRPGTTIVYVDIYTPLQDQIYHPQKYGFEESRKGCCGTGLVEAAFICNSMSITCSDRSKYVFWDSIHPTERSYSLLFEAVRPVIDFVLSKI